MPITVQPLPPELGVEGEYIDVPGARLWCWDTGGPGEPVLLCHPASQSDAIWRYQKQAFAERGYRVIAYSRRGYGRSEIAAAGGQGTSAADLLALVDRKKIDRVHILGAAAGGITALAFAVAHPGRLSSVTLAGTIVAPDEPEWRELYRRLGIDAVRDAVSTEFLELGPSYRATNPSGTEVFAALSAEAHRNASSRQPSGVDVTWVTMADMTRPVFMVTGEADLYAPPPLQALIASRLPNCETATMREVGHAPYWEQPAEFNGLVLGFLDRQRRAV